MSSRIVGAIMAALFISPLTACGNGAGASTTPSTRSTGAPLPASALTMPVSVSLFVPKPITSSSSVDRTTASERRPQYLPTSINSVSVQQTASGGSAVVNAPVAVLVVSGPNCAAATGGQTCTLTMQGALGQDAWAISSFVSGDGSGSAVSLNVGTLTVLAGTANVLALTLNPVLASLAFVPLAYSSNATTTGTLPLVLQAKDTAGAIIVGPGTYVTSANIAEPITLVSSSPGHVVMQSASAAAATVTLTTTATNDLAQIAYDGTLVAGSQTITASASGVASATLPLTLTVAAGGLSAPASIALGANLGTTSAALAISEPGYGGTFALTSSSCAGIVTFAATAGPGPSASTPVTQVGGGTCTILISAGPNSTSVVVYSTTIGIVLQ